MLVECQWLTISRRMVIYTKVRCFYNKQKQECKNTTVKTAYNESAALETIGLYKLSDEMSFQRGFGGHPTWNAKIERVK